MYWRFHWFDCPTFSAENAESVGWDERDECFACGGEGEIELESGLEKCERCGGTGHVEPVEGYSCCESADELYRYFMRRILPDDDDGVVVVFSGIWMGSGDDGELLVVPEARPRPRFLKPSQVWAAIEKRKGNVK